MVNLNTSESETCGEVRQFHNCDHTAAACPSLCSESTTRTGNEHVGEGNMSLLLLGLGSISPDNKAERWKDSPHNSDGSGGSGFAKDRSGPKASGCKRSLLCEGTPLEVKSGRAHTGLIPPRLFSCAGRGRELGEASLHPIPWNGFPRNKKIFLPKKKRDARHIKIMYVYYGDHYRNQPRKMRQTG